MHLGVAVSTERGLVVPVLRNVESLSLPRIEAEIKRVASRRPRGQAVDRGTERRTFTITNGGVFGSLLSTPILNPPQTGILGLHAIQDRPVAIQGQVQIRPMMYVALPTTIASRTARTRSRSSCGLSRCWRIRFRCCWRFDLHYSPR